MFSANASQVSNDVKYIEDFCSVYLRTGTGSSQTVTTGVKENTGALVISKSRSAATDWAWYDTFRGATYDLVSNSTAAQTTQAQGLTSFNADGHTWGTLAKVNTSGATYVDTVLKPTPKFFDVVTYTGDDTAGRNISHNLGSVPGCIIVKNLTNGSANWYVYHQSLGNATRIFLNLTDASSASTNWNSTTPTSTVFTVGNGVGVNASGNDYVAYIFAHNAGGFGLTGTDNVISCGSFTTDGSGNATVSLGYEPQWVLIKRTDGVQNWLLNDVMRGMSLGQTSSNVLFPNLSNAEYTAWSASPVLPNATGFVANGAGSGGLSASANFIYIAIRRGPMKVPTSGTSVFSNNLETSSTNPQTLTTGFPVDLSISTLKDVNSTIRYVLDRLRGSSVSSGVFLQTNGTNAETATSGLGFQNNTGLVDNGWWNTSGAIFWSFGRAPSFFDEVCYTGNSSTPRTITHNLGVAPELILVKSRSNDRNWAIYANGIGTGKYLTLTNNAPYTDTTIWANTAPTASVFTVGAPFDVNNSGYTYVAYLFATCAGVSKVGSYTGNGSSLSINCGFTGGARFVLIKRTDDAGSWHVFDTARGMGAGNDPYLRLDQTSAEGGASYDSISTLSSGFTVNQNDASNLNNSGSTYIFLAIA